MPSLRESILDFHPIMQDAKNFHDSVCADPVVQHMTAVVDAGGERANIEGPNSGLQFIASPA